MARGRRKQRIPQLLGLVEQSALYKVHVQIPVSVIIEQSDSCTHVLWKVEFSGGADEVLKIQTCLLSGLAEDWRRCRRIMRKTTRSEDTAQEDDFPQTGRASHFELPSGFKRVK